MKRHSTQARLALATFCVASLATVAAVVGAGWWSHERALKAGEEAMRQSVLLLDRSVDRAMDSLNFLTNEIIHDLQQYDPADSSTNSYLAVQAATAEHVVLAEIVDPEGRVVAASHQERIGAIRSDLAPSATESQRSSAAPSRQVTIARAMRVTDPQDPLAHPGGVIALNISANGLTGTVYLEPAFFIKAINGATTWKNQAADLFQSDGSPLTGQHTTWSWQLQASALNRPPPDLSHLAPPSRTLRSDDWLVAHRWLPHLGVHVATAVPKSTILEGWYTDLAIAGGIGLVTLLILIVLTGTTLRMDRRSRRVEAELQEMTERLNLAFEGSNDGVWDWNTVEDRAYYSPRWCALLGYDEQEIARRPQSWMDLLHPEDRPQVRTAIEDHLEGRSPVYSAVHRMRRKDGTWHWVESRGKALRSANGRAYRMVGTMTDIEEKKRQELALLAARDEAEAANRTKSEFLAVMSHEIRTPMSGVLGMAHVLLNTALTTKQRRFTELIKSSGENLLAILNDILDFSKLEAGHLDLEELDFVLNDEIDAVVRLMETPAQDKGIVLHLDDRTGGRIALRGDPTRIRQILINLIGNAIKFTEDGSVTLRCGVRAKADRQCEVNFEVVDTGIGMAEEVRGNLFQKFSQGDPSIARRYGGTGLGLAICHQLTTLMNGTIRVHSQPNVGSRFCVEINLPQATAVPRTAADALPLAHRPDLARLRVLAAEDNAVNQVLLQELLGPHVKTLDLVDDGEAAIRAAKCRTYDVVLMDVRLPGIDGVTACQEIRRLGGSWATRPIIALTANAMADQHAAYLDAGMTACLSKPIDCDKLYATLSGIAADRSAPVRLERRAMTERSSPRDTSMPEAEPLLAEDGLAQLVELIGSESVSALLQQLARQLRQSLQQIVDCREEPAVMSAVAHTLAGAAGNCQAVRVSRAARAMENTITEGRSVEGQLVALRRSVDETLPAIDAMIARLEAEPVPAPLRAAGP